MRHCAQILKHFLLDPSLWGRWRSSGGGCLEEAEQFNEGPLQPKKGERAFPDDFMRTQNMPTCQTFLPLRRGRFTRSLPGMHCDLVSWRTGLFKGLLTRPRRDEDPIAAPQWDELPTKRPGAPVPVSSTMKQHDACSPLQVSATLVPCEQRAATMQQSTAIQISGSPDLDLIQDIGQGVDFRLAKPSWTPQSSRSFGNLGFCNLRH